MKIADILKERKTLSFEIFPPKKNTDMDILNLYETIDSLTSLKPDFISVTYGAMGSTTKNTVMVSNYIKNHAKAEALAHLTGLATKPDEVKVFCDELIENNIENIMSLRGDVPLDFDGNISFPYASDLNNFIKKNYDNFCLGGGCYPEGHSECDSLTQDILNLKKKQESGAEFFITQIFYDNAYFYRFVREARKMGITVPIIAGIMPIINVKQVMKSIKMCGTSVPINLRILLEKFKDDPKAMRQIGISYATTQIIDLLANDVDGIHIYTMNKASIAQDICASIKDVLEGVRK